jgi:MYXO-CTERM domain-containing protein
VVIGDSDAAGDIVLAQVRTNQALILDTLKWLFGEERQMGLTNSEADVAIVRTAQQDKLWAYGTVVAAPGLVLLAGFAARRRRVRVAAAPAVKPKEATP